MADIIKTKPVRDAEKMVAAMLAREAGGIGILYGEPGTGRTETGKHLAYTYAPSLKADGLRICCCEDDNKRSLALALHELLFPDQKARGSVAALRKAIAPHCAGKLLIVDEAAHLGWSALEWLRWFADEAGLRIILIGTKLLEVTLTDIRNQVRLAQLNSRIGHRIIRFGALDELVEFTAACINPRFGAVSESAAKEFHARTHGYWRDAIDLGDACAILMEQQGVARLTKEIVQKAAQFQAPARLPVAV